MNNSWLHRPRATVRIVEGDLSPIGKTHNGRVGLISKRYQGCPVKIGEVWLVDVVHQSQNYFIMIPIEKIADAP